MLILLLQKQSIRVSQKALGKTSIGQMVNVMSNDVSRFDSSVPFLHYLLVGPVQVILVTIVLLFYIGPSCLVGLVVIVLFVPLQSMFFLNKTALLFLLIIYYYIFC